MPEWRLIILFPNDPLGLFGQLRDMEACVMAVINTSSKQPSRQGTVPSRTVFAMSEEEHRDLYLAFNHCELNARPERLPKSDYPHEFMRDEDEGSPPNAHEPLTVKTGTH